MAKKRILSGMRPTGPLHIGHYFGALQNWVAMQEQYESFHFVADWHVLTDHQGKLHDMPGYAREMVADWIACGLDPQKSTFYVQSAIPEVSELNLLFSMLVTVNRLSRLPSLKDMARAAHLQEMPFGLLGYPVLQAADILLPKAHLVPVGKDNESHVEITREIARRFNRTYDEVFPVPDTLIGDVPTLVGTDGKAKMSKSLDNCIYLDDDEATVNKKVKSMYTDPNRIHADVPGTVDGNPVFVYHDAFNDQRDEVDDLKERYAKGAV